MRSCSHPAVCKYLSSIDLMPLPSYSVIVPGCMVATLTCWPCSSLLGRTNDAILALLVTGDVSLVDDVLDEVGLLKLGCSMVSQGASAVELQRCGSVGGLTSTLISWDPLSETSSGTASDEHVVIALSDNWPDDSFPLFLAWVTVPSTIVEVLQSSATS